MACSYPTTVDGFESRFAVNHLAHFLLVTSLLPELKASEPSRVVMVSSVARKTSGIIWDDVNGEKNYEKRTAYGQIKTANILVAKQLDELYGLAGVHAYALHPGGIMTNLQQHAPDEEKKAMGWFKEDGTPLDLFKNVEQEASTSINTVANISKIVPSWQRSQS